MLSVCDIFSALNVMLSKQYKLFSLNVDDALQIDEINKIRGKKIAIFMIVKFIVPNVKFILQMSSLFDKKYFLVQIFLDLIENWIENSEYYFLDIGP